MHKSLCFRALSIALPVLIFLSASHAAPQQQPSRTVALTVDDLPFVPAHDAGPATPADAKAALAANRKLLRAFTRHKVLVTGFVIQKNAEDIGVTAGTAILQDWVRVGFDLGNHTYAHPDFDTLTVAQFEDQIVKGEGIIGPVMRAAGRNLEYFRFPFNHTGDTAQRHDAVAAFLTQRGYRLAPCTIENSDWMFNIAYNRMLARGDARSATRLRREYLAFTAAQIDYFRKLNAQVLGYEPPEVMLIHDNRLNADLIDDLLALFEARQYSWVSLTQAESDPVYRAPDSFVTSYGPMWAYRWAKERGVKVDGRLEPEPPQWIVDAAKR